MNVLKNVFIKELATTSPLNLDSLIKLFDPLDPMGMGSPPELTEEELKLMLEGNPKEEHETLLWGALKISALSEGVDPERDIPIETLDLVDEFLGGDTPDEDQLETSKRIVDSLDPVVDGDFLNSVLDQANLIPDNWSPRTKFLTVIVDYLHSASEVRDDVNPLISALLLTIELEAWYRLKVARVKGAEDPKPQDKELTEPQVNLMSATKQYIEENI